VKAPLETGHASPLLHKTFFVNIASMVEYGWSIGGV
jgi:hypothetical protein